MLDIFGYQVTGCISPLKALELFKKSPDKFDLVITDMAMPMMTGDMTLKLKDGQLLQTSGTGAEALRLLGILNVNYLARRLRLDFSDLYKAGLSYDSIGGMLQLDKGRVHLQYLDDLYRIFFESGKTISL